MIQLRDYQQKGVDEIRNQLRLGIKRILFCAPTGSGKTVIFSYIAKHAFDKGSSILIITNRIELLEQAGGSFDRLNLPYSNLTAKQKEIPKTKVVISMIETLNNRIIDNLNFDIVIVDEVHRSEFDKIYQYLKPETVLLGFTATPLRKGKQTPLSKYFDTIVESIDISKLIENKHLSTPKYYGVETDLKGIKKIGGEFSEKDMESKFSETNTLNGLTKNYEKLINGRKTIIFAPTIKTCLIVENELKSIAVEKIFVLHSGIDSETRKQLLSDFYSIKTGIIINCGILTTGYDCPTINTVVLYRATTSLPLFLQMVGRGSRTTETKQEFTILDFGQNIKRHDFWDSERKWSLEIPPKKDGAAPVKDCPKCEALVRASAKFCPYCNYEFKGKKKDQTQYELTELKKSAFPRVDKLEIKRIKKGYKAGWIVHQLETENEFIYYGQLKNYKPFWAKIQWNEKIKRDNQKLLNERDTNSSTVGTIPLEHTPQNQNDFLLSAKRWYEKQN